MYYSTTTAFLAIIQQSTEYENYYRSKLVFTRVFQDASFPGEKFKFASHTSFFISGKECQIGHFQSHKRNSNLGTNLPKRQTHTDNQQLCAIRKDTATQGKTLPKLSRPL